MNTYEVKTKVYSAETGEFIGNSTASIDARDKAEARFFFHHGVIEISTPAGLKIKGDLRTLKEHTNQSDCQHIWKKRKKYVEEKRRIRAFRVCKKCGFEKEINGITCKIKMYE